jgi:hypothetical protein
MESVRFCTIPKERPKPMLDYETFADFFRHNLGVRSRTSKGKSDTSSSPEKPQLVGDENYRIAKVAENTELLIGDVWAQADRYTQHWCGEDFRVRVRHWAEINSQDLFDWYSYAEQVHNFCRATGLDSALFDPLWRTWELKYSPVQPKHISAMMADHSKLVVSMLGSGLAVDLPTLLGPADYLHDGYTHPWADACGRTSMAIVMFICVVAARREGARQLLPRYTSRDAIYRGAFDSEYPVAAMVDLYRHCLVEV